MNISEVYPSKYLRAEDLQGRDVPVVISHIAIEKFNDGSSKPIAYFQGKQKGVALNKTNSTNIAAAYGSETDHWAGKPVVLYCAWVDYQGRSVQAIRVRPGTGNQPPAAPRQAQAMQAPVTTQQQPANGYGMPAGGPPAGHPADLNDDIPFIPSFI